MEIKKMKKGLATENIEGVKPNTSRHPMTVNKFINIMMYAISEDSSWGEKDMDDIYLIPTEDGRYRIIEGKITKE
jgi:hypothetical protein